MILVAEYLIWHHMDDIAFLSKNSCTFVIFVTVKLDENKYDITSMVPFNTAEYRHITVQVVFWSCLSKSTCIYFQTENYVAYVFQNSFSNYPSLVWLSYIKMEGISTEAQMSWILQAFVKLQLIHIWTVVCGLTSM